MGRIPAGGKTDKGDECPSPSYGRLLGSNFSVAFAQLLFLRPPLGYLVRC